MENEEILERQMSTKEFILKVFNYFKFLGKNWSLILIPLLFGTTYDLLNNIFVGSDKEYTGKITFHLDLEEGNNNQLGGFAATFGLGGGKVSGGDLLSAANFASIVKSQSVFQDAFMKEVVINKKKDLFINHYIKYSDIKEKEWSGNLFREPSNKKDYIFKKKDPSKFTRFENEIFVDIYTKLNEKTDVKPQEESSLIDFYSTTSREILTKIWIETLVSTTEEFYKKMKTKKTSLLLDIQQKRLDSLSYRLRNTDKKIARLTFDNPNVVDPAGILKQTQVTRDNTYLTNQYYTQIATVETLNRLLIEQTPIFTVLEPIRLPLEVIEKTGINTRLTGFLLFFASILFISIRRSYLDVMTK